MSLLWHLGKNLVKKYKSTDEEANAENEKEFILQQEFKNSTESEYLNNFIRNSL